MKIPIVADAATWSSVAPINLILPEAMLIVMLFSEIELNKNNAFSSAAKPRADVIKYIIGSNGSSFSLFFRDEK